jgi:signal transduction histidine kinase
VRNRLLLVMVGVVALVLVVHDVPLARHLERVERDRLTTSLERDAFILAGRAEESVEDGTVAADPIVRAIVARYFAEEQVRVAIIDSDANGLFGSDGAVVGQDFSNRPEIVEALTGAPDVGERYSRTLGEDLFFVAVPVLSGSQVVGVVRLSAPERVVADRVADKVHGLFIVAGISLLIAIAVAWLFARSVTRPLRRLEFATHQLASGDLSARAGTDEGPDEVRGLGDSFNLMAARLQQLVDRQRSFAGTASHQLRTPLTALRLRLEQLSMQVDAEDDASHSIDEALIETDRLHRMIEGLLALSRAEDTATGPVITDVAAVVRDRLEYWRPLADERRIALVASVPDVTMALAVADGVEQMIDNLVDNAFDVSPPESELHVSVEAVGQMVELHVIDAGPGLSEPDRTNAFERFWRAPGAPTGGSGLGLAIVRQLAEAGGGTAELRAAPSGGIDAVVSLRSP